LPWSIFLGAAAWHTWRRLLDGERIEKAAVRLLIVWFATYLVLFSIASTKLPNYVLPAYPAAALLVGHFLDRWRRGEVAVPAWLMRLGLCGLALAGVGVAAGMLVAGGVGGVVTDGRSYPGLVGWAWLGLVPIAGAVVASWNFERGRRGVVVAATCASGVLFAALVLSGPLGVIDRHKAARELAAALPADHDEREVRLAAYGWFQPSLVYYARREVERPAEVAHVRLFLAQPLPAYLFVPEQTWAEIRGQMPAGARVVGRRRDLYAGRVIVVVSNSGT
jgi:4-amino-4-deoxy-L-arabinose transferase-like glycosyltransferase